MAHLTGLHAVTYRAYRALPSRVRAAPERLLRVGAEREISRQPWFTAGPPERWLLGPLNTAGQADAWARAARDHAGALALSLSAERVAAGASRLGYATDVHLSRRAQLRGMGVHRARVTGQGRWHGATGVLSESGRSVLDDVFRRTVLDDLPALEGAGARVAVVVHGSELRDLHEHAERDPVSPFRGVWDERWHRLQGLVDRTRAVVDAFPGPVLVTTIDMLEAVPGSRLLPVTVQVDDFASDAAALQREVPVVLHAPTNPRLKATDVIEPVLHRLQEEGRIIYRRLTGVPHDRMPAAIASADVVVDQLALGNVGVLAVEAMAAGRLVIGHATARVRSLAREQAGDGSVGRSGVDGAAVEPAGAAELPLVEADPHTFAEVMEDVLTRPEAYRPVAQQGPAWARAHHDGRRAAQVLREILGA